ncbi:MAG: DNA primase [Gemmatimonadota bacterium]|nr:DNA primase [Gemmatimonadota bacterium]
MSIPDDVIEQVRDTADLVDVLGEHVQLKRTGADYRGPCPFHGGTHRNFAVIPKKQMFYCFVCHAAGDVFTFYMKKFGMDYPTAVREVARRVGITIPERTASGPDPLEPFYEAVAVAHEWYARQLAESSEAAAARRYVTGRGYALEALAPYGLGYAPPGKAFLEAMRKLGIADEVLLGAGLALRRDDGALRARFWGRLLFPIHDLRGRVVGFGGRVIGDGEPKYLNSPESDVFHKGRLLYNLHGAKHPIRRAEHAVLVEGYFDVLRLVLAGLEHVVAPLGTGFTPDQGKLLRRFTERVTLLFDSDAAGLRATFRTADELLRAGISVGVATMPEGEDPDTLVQTGGAAAVERVLRDGVDVFERKLQLLERKGWLQTLDGRRRALDRLLPTLRAAADPVTRDLYVSRVGEALGVSRDVVLREAADRPQPVRRRAEPGPAREGTPRGRGGPERDLIRVMLQDAEMRERVSALVTDRTMLRQPDAALFEAVVALPADVAPATLLETLDGEARVLLAGLLDEAWHPPDRYAVVAGSVDRLLSRRLERQLLDLERRLPLVSDDEKATLAQEKDQLSREISRLNPARWNVIRKGRSSAR